jgi:hypothetical protein
VTDKSLHAVKVQRVTPTGNCALKMTTEMEKVFIEQTTVKRDLYGGVVGYRQPLWGKYISIFDVMLS